MKKTVIMICLLLLGMGLDSAQSEIEKAQQVFISEDSVSLFDRGSDFVCINIFVGRYLGLIPTNMTEILFLNHEDFSIKQRITVEREMWDPIIINNDIFFVSGGYFEPRQLYKYSIEKKELKRIKTKEELRWILAYDERSIYTYGNGYQDDEIIKYDILDNTFEYIDEAIQGTMKRNGINCFSYVNIEGEGVFYYNGKKDVLIKNKEIIVIDDSFMLLIEDDSTKIVEVGNMENILFDLGDLPEEIGKRIRKEYYHLYLSNNEIGLIKRYKGKVFLTKCIYEGDGKNKVEEEILPENTKMIFINKNHKVLALTKEHDMIDTLKVH